MPSASFTNNKFRIYFISPYQAREMLFPTRMAYWFAVGFGLYATANAAVLQRISDWGPNPSKIAQLHVYVPDKVAAKPSILLGVVNFWFSKIYTLHT